MKIIILGAGQVGGTLAENLVGENNDITVVDTNGERLRTLQDKFDLRVVAGAWLSSTRIAGGRCRRRRYAGCCNQFR
ncbi:trk system potassium uptake protein TrkA [Escherichia coli]|nr:trk system potassium uptake protein TrkA [Escherichia coli]